MLANMKLESELPEHTLLFSFMKSTIYFDLETGDSEQTNGRQSCLTSPTLHNIK